MTEGEPAARANRHWQPAKRSWRAQPGKPGKCKGMNWKERIAGQRAPLAGAGMDKGVPYTSKA
jgi:hypothetical protein